MTVTAHLSEQGGEGSNLLLIHGYGSDSFAWSALLARLMLSFRVYSVDLPGHGRASPEVGDGSVETLAAAVARAVSTLSWPVHAVGHSLGGAVAVALLRQAPGLLSSLTLLAPAGMGAGVDAHFLDDFPEAETEQALRPLLHQLVARDVMIQPPMVSHVLGDLSQNGRRDALRKLARTIRNLAPLSVPADIPVQIAWGKNDTINPINNATREHACATVFADCGHMPHMEVAAKTARLIIDGSAA